jgi:hypothetical protein
MRRCLKIDIDKLRERIAYDKTKGLFMYLKPSNSATKGWWEGTVSAQGYCRLHFGGRGIQAHNVAWMLTYGKITEGLEVDHIDGDRTNNKISNLRLATRSQNLYNRPNLRGDTSIGKGVSIHRKTGLWRVRLNVNKEQMNFGYYRDLELAELVAQEAISKYHGEFSNYA